MQRFLRKPSPAIESTRVKFLLSFGIGLFVFVFLYVFEPFGVFHELRVTTFEAAAGFGGITFGVDLIYLFGWYDLIVKRSSRTITNGEQLLTIFIHVIVVAVVNSFFMRYIYLSEITLSRPYWQTLFDSLFFTFSIALFPIIFTQIYFELKLSYDHLKKSRNVAIDHQKRTEPATISIPGDSQETPVSITNHSFRFARASGNYVEYYSFNGNGVERQLQRITLSRLEVHFENTSFNVMKTHRSYIVNLDAVSEINGNAQGYSLQLRDLDETVPVSRANIKNFNLVMNG